MSLFRNSVVQNAASDQTAAGDDEDSEPPLFKSVHQSPSRVSVDVTTAAISLSPPLPRRTDYGSLPDHDRVFLRPPPHNVSHMNAIQVVTIEWKRDDRRAWAVCLASLYATGVTWGTAGSVSVLLPALVTIFQHSIVSSSTSNGSFLTSPADVVERDAFVHSKVQFVYSVNTAALYLACLLGPFLVERLGCRLTLLAGVTLSVGGALLPALWPAVSLWLWWLCFGLANGTGNAVVYVASQVALEQAFDRRFGTAASIASLGMALANVLLPFLWEALLALGSGNSASGSTTSAQHTAHGLSLVMYSIVFSYLFLLPMLPLFGSPFFMAAARVLYGHSDRSEPKNCSPYCSLTSSSSRIGSPSSSSKTEHVILETIPMLNKETVETITSKRRLFHLFFDLPPRGLKYAPSGSEHLIQSRDSTEAGERFSESVMLALSGARSQWLTVWRLLRERNVFVFLLSYCSFLAFNSTPDSLSAQQAADLFPGVPAAGSLTVVTYGLLQALGKLLIAPLGDWFPSLFGRTLLVATGIMMKGFFVGAVPVALGFAHRLGVALSLNGVYGFWDGLQYGVYSALILSLVGSERYSLALAMSYSTSALPILLGPPLAGLALDFSHDYSLPFALSGMMISLSGLALLLIEFSRDSQSAPERRLGYEKLSAYDALVGIERGPGLIGGAPLVREMTTMEEEKVQIREANTRSVL